MADQSLFPSYRPFFLQNNRNYAFDKPTLEDFPALGLAHLGVNATALYLGNLELPDKQVGVNVMAEVSKRITELCEKIRGETDGKKFQEMLDELNYLLDGPNDPERFSPKTKPTSAAA